MSTSIMTSFFFLQLVENFRYYEKKNVKSARYLVSEDDKKFSMELFSRLYTVMETQAVGFPISEEDLEVSAALVASFSMRWCMGSDDPYLVTPIMWEAYSLGELSVSSENYIKLYKVASFILKENAKHKSNYASQPKQG